MFMHKSKKGFTIVELVIVIAVIAILAAVLIPTFSNLVKKANIASDTSLAKNINTALTAYEATNGKVDEFSDVIAAAKEAGYIISNLNPTTEGCYFVWESSTNQILLVDSTDGYKVIYANNEKYATAGNTWYFAVRTQAEADTITAALTGVNAKLAISNTSTLNAEINVAGEKTIYIDGGLEVDAENTIKLDNADAKITIDLGSSEVTGGSANASLSAIPFENVSGNLTLKNGVINATGQFIDLDGKKVDTSISSEPGSYTKIDGTTINIAINGESGYVALYGDADVVNATVTSGDCGINAGGGSTVTVADTTMEANYGFFVTNSGNEQNGNKTTKLVVNSGSYKTIGNGISGYMFEIYNGNVEINGGTFNTKLVDKVFYFYNAGSKITITGGTFNGKEFSAITTVAEWENMCKGATGRDFDAVISNGVVTITSK